MKGVLGEDYQYNLWVLLNQARDAIYKCREKELYPLGISLCEALVLVVIQAIGKRATPSVIARWILREPHSVSGLLDRMEKGELIKKTKDLDKKNLVRVSLTKKGKQVYALSAKSNSIHHIFTSLSEEEQHQFALILIVLRDKALEQLGVQKPPLPQLGLVYQS